MAEKQSPKLLDEISLQAIKKYIDDGDAASGKVDDVKVNNTSVVSNKIANLAVDGTYNSSSNKIASQSTVSNAIAALDLATAISNTAGKTVATITESDGIVGATFQDIQITESQVTNLTTDLAGKQPLDADLTAIAAISGTGFLKRTGNDTWTLDSLTGAMTFVGVSTTDPSSSSGATVSGHTTWKKGEVVIYQPTGSTGYQEYVATADDNAHWELLGDADSYALKTTTISAGSGLTGGGDLSSNRTISHATPTGAATKTSGFYKFSTDGFGHVNGTTAVAKADLTGLGVADDSLVVHLAGAETITGVKTFAANTLKLTGDHGTITTVTGGTGGEMLAGLTSSGNVIATSGSLIAFTGATYTKYKDGSINIVDTSGGGSYNYTLALPIKDGTIATLGDIPSVSDFVKGPSTAVSGNIALFDGTTGKLIKDGGTSLSTITSHIGNNNIHITSAERSTWNAMVSNVKSTATGTGNDAYYKLQKTVSGTDLDFATTLSYNETLAILQGA